MQTRLELYRKVTPLAQLGIWEHNYITGEVYWNSVMRNIYEVTDDYVPFLDKLLGFYADEDAIKSLIAKAIQSGRPQTDQFKIQTANGQTKCVKVNIKAESADGKCRLLYGTLQDVSKYVDLIEKITEMEKQFHQAFDFAPIGMALVGLDGKWLKINRSLEQLLGYSESELQWKTFQDLTYEEDLGLDLHHVNMLLNGQINSYTIEKRYLHKDGRIVWAVLNVSLVHQGKKPSYFISQIKDITERKKSIEQLVKERQRLDNIIKSTGVGTWEWNITTDAVITNEQAGAILGFYSKTGPNMSWWLALIHPGDKLEHATRLDECFKGITKHYHFQCRMLHRLSGWRWVEINGKVVQWDGPAPILMLGTFTDIDERKRMELERDRNFDLITRQNSRLLNFAHIVSHDLRSYAGNIKVLADMLCEEEDENEKKTLMQMLKTNGSSLLESLSYLNSVVEIQTKVELNRQPLNLLEKVYHTAQILSEQLKRLHADLKIRIEPDLTILYEPAYLESILLNLISNCIKYASPLRLLKISISCHSNEEGHLLEISDNGQGIDLELHGKKLFGMYKTFHGNPDARGIGLFLVKNQVEAMGGRISVESQVDKGTSFKIQITSDEKN